jgi:hypothetical protein
MDQPTNHGEESRLRVRFRLSLFTSRCFKTIDTLRPDESFIVFGSMHPGPNAHERLFIAMRDGAGWGKPVDLGVAINGNGASDTNEARLGPDHRTLYFSSERTAPVSFPRARKQAEADLARIGAWDNGSQNIWSVSLAPWLDAAKLDN